MLTELSRRIVHELIEAGGVRIDGVVPAKPAVKVELGAIIEIDRPEAEGGPLPDPSVELEIVHVDDDVIVINKSPLHVVHPGAGVTTGTIVNGLLAQFPEVVGLGDDPVRPGIVHRLDKGTSGLLMVARSARAFTSLSEQLADRTVMRRYVALVDGLVGSSEGLIDGPLGRSPRDATRQAVVVGGREARTRYDVLERFEYKDVNDEDTAASLLHCRLETGRTHQIRAHLEAIGHPVAGDARYGSKTGAFHELGRPFLHAETLGFIHPGSDELVVFESELPTDLVEVIDRLRAVVLNAADDE